MADPTTAELDDVTFESGVDGSGDVASPAFDTWNSGTSPATYSATADTARKWDNDVSGNQIATSGPTGTGGGTVTYSFASDVTASERTAFTDALTLWSDEADVTFKQVARGSSSDITFKVTNSGATDNASATTPYSSVGTTQIASENPGDTITFDNSGAYGTIGSFSAYGGYGVDATVHEIGHSLGLGHSGPYDDSGGNNSATAQYNAYDSRQWSVMSYIDPSNFNATYYSQYPVQGTVTTDQVANGNGGYTDETVAPETPMIDDILAVQRLYGAPTVTALSGGQVFGFNCNITDGSEPFFDFTKNVNPFITLYDTGTDNTLDCSGFSTNCTINLNPGTFSTASAGLLTNNIGIAYGTRIDTAIGGSGNDTFTVNADNDVINGGAGTNTVVFSGARSSYAITPDGTGREVITDTATGVTDTMTNIQALQFSDQTDVPCYGTGTAIRTIRHGVATDIAVEQLVLGDRVATTSGAHRPIRWIGHRTIDCRRHPRPGDVLPVRIAAHALGANRPVRELVLSPGHAICVDLLGEALIPAAALINGSTIVQREVERVTYWHVELDSHDLLLAENLPAESYLEMGNRAFFAESDLVALAAAPDAALRTHADFCRPFQAAGPLVDAVRARLAARADRIAVANDEAHAA